MLLYHKLSPSTAILSHLIPLLLTSLRLQVAVQDGRGRRAVTPEDIGAQISDPGVDNPQASSPALALPRSNPLSWALRSLRRSSPAPPSVSTGNPTNQIRGHQLAFASASAAASASVDHHTPTLELDGVVVEDVDVVSAVAPLGNPTVTALAALRGRVGVANEPSLAPTGDVQNAVVVVNLAHDSAASGAEKPASSRNTVV
jgi:hypothetical protein